MKRRLPTGIRTFREIREDGCYYVDKMAHIERLVDEYDKPVLDARGLPDGGRPSPRHSPGRSNAGAGRSRNRIPAGGKGS